eukprot:16346-Heterococcus_DN1.PRE.2
MPNFSVPCSTLLSAIVPLSVYLSSTGQRNGPRGTDSNSKSCTLSNRVMIHHIRSLLSAAAAALSFRLSMYYCWCVLWSRILTIVVPFTATKMLLLVLPAALVSQQTPATVLDTAAAARNAIAADATSAH